VTLRERAERLVGLLDRRIVGRRYFPPLSAAMHDKPAVDELVRCVPDHLLITNIWIGEGELTFPEAYGEELKVLGPVKAARGSPALLESSSGRAPMRRRRHCRMVFPQIRTQPVAPS